MNKNSKPSSYDVTIFDVDGVLTNLSRNQADEKLIILLMNLLDNNVIVVLNTGRSLQWLEEVILKKLLANSINQLINFKNFFILAEKGGIWVDFTNNNLTKINPIIDQSISVPKKLIDSIKYLVASKYHQKMFFDSTKKTMVTIEKNKETTLEEFQLSQLKLIEEIKEIVTSFKFNKQIEIDLTTIATDVQHVIAGKDYGVEKILSWLQKHDYKVNKFFTFGDSSSDFAMAQSIFTHNKPVMHIHVGESKSPIANNFPIIITNKKYAQGTKEFFNIS